MKVESNQAASRSVVVLIVSRDVMLYISGMSFPRPAWLVPQGNLLIDSNFQIDSLPFVLCTVFTLSSLQNT